MEAYEKIGQKLQKAREENGLSQGDLAKRLGCTQASLSNYELGKRRLYLVDLQRIGQILGKPVSYFLDESKEKNSDAEDIGTILKKQYMQEILFAASGLKPSQRKSILDYILWQRSKGSEE